MSQEIETNELIVSWTNSMTCRMNNDGLSLLEVTHREQVKQLCMALSEVLNEMLKGWVAVQARSAVTHAKEVVRIKSRYLEQAAGIYKGWVNSTEQFDEASPKVRAVVEATSLMANLIRTADVLEEALLDYRRQGALGSRVKVESVVDTSLAGVYQYANLKDDSGRNYRNTPFRVACSQVTNKAVANVFRSDEAFVEEMAEAGMSFLRDALYKEN